MAPKSERTVVNAAGLVQGIVRITTKRVYLLARGHRPPLLESP